MVETINWNSLPTEIPVFGLSFITLLLFLLGGIRGRLGDAQADSMDGVNRFAAESVKGWASPFWSIVRQHRS